MSGTSGESAGRPAHSKKMTITILEDAEEVAHAAAERFVSGAQAAIESRGRFSVALSGGSTPKHVYALLANDAYRNRVDWSRTHIFFGDERCVPANHPDSNYRMAFESLVSHVPLPLDNVHPMQGFGDPEVNARAYEQELRTLFPNTDWPRIDLVFLGLGEDGHTASLFPHTSALKQKTAWVVANWVEKLNSFRLTLTIPAINNAVEIKFLVTGSAKAKPVALVLKGPPAGEELPAQLILPADGSLEWLLDQPAAANL